jgi:hypothetical protein
MMKHPMNNPALIPAPRWAGILSLLALLVMVLGSVAMPDHSASAQDAESTPEVADEMPKLGIKPADGDGIFFTARLEPGEQTELSVELFNAGKNDVKVLTYAADIYSLVNGGFGVELSDEPASGTTTWLDYKTQTFDLPHGEGRIESFTVEVPKDTAPGEYITSLVIQTAEAVKGEGDLTVDQILRQAIAVAITVPGEEHPALEIGAVTYKDNPLIDSLLIEVRNTGNLHLKPEGTVQIVDATGATVLDVNVGMDSVYAGTTTMLELGLTQSFPVGDYRAVVHLEDTKRGGSAVAEGEPFSVTQLTELATTSMQIDALNVDLVRTADGQTVQFADVSVAITNAGGRVPNAQIVLHVERDGELVEDYPLTTGTSLESGPTSVRQRYLPLTGWTPGSYSFSVSVKSVDLATGNVTVLATSSGPVLLEIK